MSAGALPDPIQGVRQTMAFDRAYGRLGQPTQPIMQRPPGGGMTPLPPAGGEGGTNMEAAKSGDANKYAVSAFNQWYDGLKPDELSQFKPTGNTMGTIRGIFPNQATTDGKGVTTTPIQTDSADNTAGIQKEAARQHFTQNILAKDPTYLAMQGQSTQARDARINMTPLQQYRGGEDALANTEANTAGTTSATSRFNQMTPIAVQGAGIANQGAQQANDRYAAMTPPTVAEQQNKVTGGTIANTQAQGLVQPNIAYRSAQAGVEEKAADQDFIPKAEHDKAIGDLNTKLTATQKQLETALARLEAANKPGKTGPFGLPAPAAPAAARDTPSVPQAAASAAPGMQLAPMTRQDIDSPQTGIVRGPLTPAMDSNSGGATMLASPQVPPGAILNPDGSMTLNGIRYKRKGA